LAPDTDTARLALVLWTELLRTGVRDALERAAVLVLGTVGVLGTAREARVIGARATCAGDTLLGLGTRRVETGQQTLAVDADARIATLEVELTAEGGRVGILFERVEAKTVFCARRAQGALVRVFALPDATDRRTHFPDGTIGVRCAQVSFRRRLRIAFVPTAQEAAAVAQRPVGNTHVARIFVAGGDSE
jgi:hypothetical protein